MKPPWQMPWPFTMSGRTLMLSVAVPGLTASIFMPNPRAAWSSGHMISAQRHATCSGVSMLKLKGNKL